MNEIFASSKSTLPYLYIQSYNGAVEQAYDLPEYKELLRKVLSELVDKMTAADSEKVFHYPVTDEIAPDYSDTIKRPICLSDIRSKVFNSEYRDIEEFKADVSFCMCNRQCY